jgi:hypothetical protein
MALEFTVINLEKDNKNSHYNARILFDGEIGDYEIRTDAHIRYLGWLDCKDKSRMLSILDGYDEPFNGKLPHISIIGINGSRKNEKALKEAFLDFIRENYSEGNNLKIQNC